MKTLTTEKITTACQKAQAPLDRARFWLEDARRLLEQAVDEGWKEGFRERAAKLVGYRQQRSKR